MHTTKFYDVASETGPVVFCLDRGGLVGADGLLTMALTTLRAARNIPNMIVSAPMNEAELHAI